MTEETPRKYRVAVIVGSGTGDVDGICDVYDVMRERGNTKYVSPTSVPRIMASTAAANVSASLGAEGPGFAVSAACAGGAVSLCMGALLLRAGLADLAVVGGTEAANSIFHGSFEAMRAYSADDEVEGASRPFAADRCGFVFGEGAGILVLETRRTADARGVPALGVLAGYAMRTSHAGDIVSPSLPSAVDTMVEALANARIPAAAVGYVNAHATGTKVGDATEVQALRAAFAGRTVPYSSTKGYTGHGVSAAGAIEAILTLDMLRGGWLAASVGAAPLDAEFEDYGPILTPRKESVDFALSNSFGFGGACVSLSSWRAAEVKRWTATDVRRAIDGIWRIESARLIAGLTRIVRDVGVAEDLAQEALILAIERWPDSGVPDNPGAWLMTTAKNRALDFLRRTKRVARKHEEIGHDLQTTQDGAAPDLEAAIDDAVGDDLLRLMLIACHPVLSTEARVALTLRLLGGLTTEEIARAFLVPEPTIAQRIVRAKRTLSEERIAFEAPSGAALVERLASLLEVIYPRLQ